MYLDERSNSLLKELLRHPDTSSTNLQAKFGLTRNKSTIVSKKLTTG